MVWRRWKRTVKFGDLLYIPLEGDKEFFDDIPPMRPLEVDKEEVKEGKWIKVLTPNKLLNRLQVLLAQIQAGNSSYKLKKNQTNAIYFVST